MTATYKVGTIADSGKINMKIVRQVFKHIHMGLLFFGGANQAILAAKMPGNGIGFSQPKISC